MNSRRVVLILVFLAVLAMAASAQDAQPATSAASAAGPARGNAQPADPGFEHLRLWQGQYYRVSRSSVEECIVVLEDGRFHREKVEQAPEGTHTKAFQGTLSSEDLAQLAAIVGSDEFRSVHFDALGQELRPSARKLSVDIWRKNGKQSLNFPDEEIRKKYDDTLEPLLGWWKKIDREETPATNAITGCQVGRKNPAQPKVAAPVASPVAPAPGAQHQDAQNIAGSGTVSPSAIPFFYLRLWQSEQSGFSGVRTQKCMVIHGDGSFHREEISQGANGTRSKVFKGTLSPAELTALTQITSTGQFRSIVHVWQPEQMTLRSDPAIAMNIWRPDGPQEFFFPDRLSRQPYKDTVGALVKWWDEASKQPATPLGDSDADSCRPPAEDLNDLLSSSAATAGTTAQASKDVASGANTAPAGDITFSQFRISRQRSLSWYGSDFWGGGGSENASSCLLVGGDGRVHGEQHLQFHGQNVAKVFEGTLIPADLKTLQVLLSPQALKDIPSPQRLIDPAERASANDRLLLAVLRRGGQRKLIGFPNPVGRIPTQFTDPLLLWWEKVSAQFPEAKNAVANHCALANVPGRAVKKN